MAGKDKGYEVFKEAHADTNEVRTSKRTFEQKIAHIIKSDSNRLYAYVRSMQNVRDKVGPLMDNAGNILAQDFFKGRGIKCALQFSVHEKIY